jgi:hypothetical protein
MIRETVSQPSRIGGAPTSEPSEPFQAALDTVIRLALTLTSAIANVAYATGARVRGELECALSRAQELAECLPEGIERAEGLRQLGELQAIATRQLMIAPAPSAAAIDAASAGDDTAWEEEEEAWIAHRLALGSSPNRDVLHRARRDTRPESPRALRNSPEGAEDACATAPAMSLSPAVAPDEEVS